jgi:hypothetical protein
MAAAPDVNGDAIPDYLLSTPDMIPEPNDTKRSGVFLVFGGYETEVLAFTSMRPATLATGESEEVTITGTGFREGIQVYFGALPAIEVKVQDPHTLIVKPPVAAIPETVDVRLVLADSREVRLQGGFTYVKVLSFSVGTIAGATEFVAPKIRVAYSTEIRPTVLGDISGDGIEDFALRGFEPEGDAGWISLVEGGTPWVPVVSSDSVDFSARTARLRNSSGRAPRIFPLGDLDRDGRGDYAFNTLDYDSRQRGEFIVLFDFLPPGLDIEYDVLRDDPVVSVYTSRKSVGLDVQGTDDFDGDGSVDLVTHTTNSQPQLGPAEIVVVRGPLLPGEKLDLDAAPEGRVLWFFDSAPHLNFARNVLAAGDVNGDGRGDLVFNNEAGDRALYLFLGHEPVSSHVDLAGLESSGILLRIPHDPGMLEQSNLRAAGDVNADGLMDVLLHRVTSRGQGLAGVLHGRVEFGPDVILEQEIGGTGGFFIFDSEERGHFGHDAAVRGDLDGDGRADLAVGSARFQDLDSLPATPGELMVIHDVASLEGEATLADVPRPRTVVSGAIPKDRFGATVEVLGDQDADGLPELLVEAQFFFNSHVVRGKTYLIPGASLFGPEATPPFIRGDANADGAVNITDPIAILGTLFLGAPRPACEDRDDTNDDGVLNITDGIYLLAHLFQGGPPPPEPYPGAGEDPTADALPCRS